MDTTNKKETSSLTLTGPVLEVGYIDTENGHGFVIDRGNSKYAAVYGLTEDEVRGLAADYGKPLTIAIGLGAAGVAPDVGRLTRFSEAAVALFAPSGEQYYKVSDVERLLATKAAAQAAPQQAVPEGDPNQAHVLPPTRGTGSQHDADASVLTIEKIVQLIDENTDRDFGLIVEPFARAIEAEVTSRGRAQGGNTSEESGSDLAHVARQPAAPEADRDITELRDWLAAPTLDSAPQADDEELRTYRQALEIIGVRDCTDPQEVATAALVGTGFWSKERSELFCVPQAERAAVPRGWKIMQEPGVIVVEKNGLGGVALGERFNRDEIAASIFEQFLKDLLAEAFAAPVAQEGEHGSVQDEPPEQALALVNLLQRWASWIVRERPKNLMDHACARCVPHSDMLVDGFSCVYHEAVDTLGGLIPRAGTSSTEGSAQAAPADLRDAAMEEAAKLCELEAAASSLTHSRKACWQSEVAGRCAANIRALRSTSTPADDSQKGAGE